MNTTTFKNRVSTAPVLQCTIADVLERIKSPEWQKRIEKCHTDLKAKDYLPCFTPTGTFSHRSIAGLDVYNGVICLDVDNIDNVEEVKGIARTLPFVYAAYITPSGRGLKVIVKTNATRDSYTIAERIIARKWEIETGALRDNHCKDIARIQYISYDPDLIFNPEAEVVDIWPSYRALLTLNEWRIKDATDLKERKKAELERDQLRKDAGDEGKVYELKMLEADLDKVAEFVEQNIEKK